MRAKLTVRVSSTSPDSSLRVEVLDSAGQVAGSGSGSGGPAGVSVELPLLVELLADDAEKPLRLNGTAPILPQIAEAYEESAVAQDSNVLALLGESARMVDEAREFLDAYVQLDDELPTVESRFENARAALARRLARIEHLEARHAERAAATAGESRTAGG